MEDNSTSKEKSELLSVVRLIEKNELAKRQTELMIAILNNPNTHPNQATLYFELIANFLKERFEMAWDSNYKR
jgi:hypothetical protein